MENWRAFTPRLNWQRTLAHTAHYWITRRFGARIRMVFLIYRVSKLAVILLLFAAAIHYCYYCAFIRGDDGYLCFARKRWLIVCAECDHNNRCVLRPFTLEWKYTHHIISINFHQRNECVLINDGGSRLLSLTTMRSIGFSAIVATTAVFFSLILFLPYLMFLNSTKMIIRGNKERRVNMTTREKRNDHRWENSVTRK